MLCAPMVGRELEERGVDAATFAPFALQPVDYDLNYRTVKKCAKNAIKLFANFTPPKWEGAT